MPVLLTILSFVIAVLWHETAHFVVALMVRGKVVAYSLGFGPVLKSVKSRGVEFRLSLIPFGGYIHLLPVWNDTPVDENGSPIIRSNADRLPALRQMAITIAGPVSNFILAIFCISGIVWHKGVSEAVIPLQLESVSQASVAEKAGLRAGDIIINDDLNELAKHIRVGSSSKVFSENAGEMFTFHIIRNGKSLDIPLRLDNEAPYVGGSLKGIERAVNPLEALYVGTDYTYFLITRYFKAVSKIFKNNEVEKSLSSPIGGVSVVSKAVAAGPLLPNFLLAISAFSLLMAIFNLLPFPILDGGQILLLTLGWIFGMDRLEIIRPWLMRISSALLITLLAVATFNDLLNLF